MIHWNPLKKSLGYAKAGLVTAYRSEQSFRLQVLAAVLVIALALFVRVTVTEYLVLLLLITAVLVLELVNSIFERLLDAFKPRLHPIIKEAKDMMAAAVLLMSLVSLVIGVLIFYPYIRLFFS